ncbi:MAG TPA: hypothetical protein VGF99_20585 [Myxococcota bacterium]
MTSSIVKFVAAATFGAVLVALPALAQEAVPPAPTAPPPPAPSAAEIQRVTNYFLNGKDAGPILIELSLCADAKKNADGKLACEGPLPDTIKKGDSITAFVKFFGPKGGKYDDIKIRFLLGGEVRSTSDFTVTESWTGYSNYKKTTASKAGLWEVELLRGDVVLGKKAITVQ